MRTVLAAALLLGWCTPSRAQQLTNCAATAGYPANFVPRAHVQSLNLNPFPIAAEAWVSAAFTFALNETMPMPNVTSLFIAIEPYVFGMYIGAQNFHVCDIANCSAIRPGATIEADMYYNVMSAARFVPSLDIQARLVDKRVDSNAQPPVVWSETLACVRLSTPVQTSAPSPPPPAPATYLALGPCLRPSTCGRPTAPGYRDPFCSSYHHTFLPNASDCDGDGIVDHLCYATQAYSTSPGLAPRRDGEGERIRAFAFISSAGLNGGCENAMTPFTIREYEFSRYCRQPVDACPPPMLPSSSRERIRI